MSVLNGLHPKSKSLAFLVSMAALFFSFAAGFTTVLWRERQVPAISLRHLDEIMSFLRREDYSRALERLRIATKIAPSDESAIQLLGVALHQTGDLAGAKTCYHRVLKIKPWHFDAHFRVGLLHLEQQNSEAAVWHNEIAVRLQPTHAAARTNLAVALLRQGKTTEATAHLNEVLRLNPGFPPAKKILDQLRAAKP
jgi:Flp pilus assembly protein TadD